MEENSNLSPEELKMLTIAFMGQHLTGDLKQLQNNIVSPNSTLRANNLNPSQIINTIPSSPRPNRPIHNVVNAGINAEPVHTQQHIPQPQPRVQALSFNENTSELKEIISILKNIEQKLDNLKIS